MEGIRVIEVEAQTTAGVRHVVRTDQLDKHFTTAFDDVAGRLQAAGVAPAGPPFARYRGGVAETVDVEAGFPVPDGTAEVPGLVMDMLPAGRVVEAVHVGDYDGLRDTYARVAEWAEQRGVAVREDSWEVYESGPSSDPDPANWRTRVLWPVTGPQVRSTSS